MRRRRIQVGSLLAALIVCALVTACTDSDGDAPPAPVTGLAILLPADAPEAVTLAAQDTAALLSAATGAPVPVVQALGAGSGTLHLALADMAISAAVFTDAERADLPPESYRVRTAAVDGWRVVAIQGGDARGTVFGLYRVLETMGLRFFHPEETYLPPAEGVTLPVGASALDLFESPAFGRRGLHVHTMHPIEATEFLMRPGPEHLAWAMRLMDWHVRNRQNYFQFELLRTCDFEGALEHFRAWVDYAHRRGMQVGVVVTYHFLQQKAWQLLPGTDAEYREELERGIDRLMQVPWDHIHLEIGSSEFTPVPDLLQIRWMDNTVAYLAERYPGTDASVKIHVSTNQVSEAYGINFNLIPQFADPRMGVYPHTVQFYGLTGPAPTYGNEDFRWMYEWLLSQIGRRKVYYYPESAYWVLFDIDVPLFLPVYLESRWTDVALLAGSGIDGHVTFSSGHEWNYWLTDWAVARALWDPGVDWRTVLAEFTGIFGAAAPAILQAIADLAENQQAMLIDWNLAPYLIGADPWSELSARTDSSYHPRGVTFEELYRMDGAALDAFERSVVIGLSTMADVYEGLARRVNEQRENVPQAALSWYEELADGFLADSCRAGHAYRLYAGAVAARRAELTGDPQQRATADEHFAEALATTERIQEIVGRREAAYRYPLAYSTGWGRSLTAYDYRYLWMPHTAYVYRRYEKQAIDKDFRPFLMNVVDPFWFLW